MYYRNFSYFFNNNNIIETFQLKHDTNDYIWQNFISFIYFLRRS